MNTEKYTERNSNEKGLRKNKKRKTINLDDEPSERKRRRSSRDGTCLWLAGPWQNLRNNLVGGTK